MPEFETVREVRHKSADMFELVADIEKYPEFLPFCQSLQIQSTRQTESCPVHRAYMVIGYKGLRQGFTSLVIEERAQSRIRMRHIDGPFLYMEGQWLFEEREGGCAVRFSIDYAFKSRALSVLMGSVFDKAFRRFAEAFETRADEIYG